MFNCTKCHKITAPRVPAEKVVVEKRQRVYENKNKDGIIKLSYGWEIVREASLCPECAK